jgi:ketosteroid isomerase-like protein
MTRHIPIILLAAATVSLAFGQAGTTQAKAKVSSQATVEDEFRKIENQWAEADKNKDAAALGRLLADDWIFLGPLGSETKAQHLAGLKSGDDKLESITLIEMRVRVFGNTAVVTGREHEKSTSNGKDTSGDYLWTDVFVKRQGHWLAVNSQDTPLTHP